MKRIKSACLELTIQFLLKDNIGHAAAIQAVKEEVAHYKSLLDRNHTKYKILQEKDQADGSVIIKMKKQYNNYDYGDYFD